jgi:hypothetical protein
MNSALYVGISSQSDTLEIAALESGQAAVAIQFPANDMGVEAIKLFLADYAVPVRLAVAGVAALSLALALGNAPRREVVIVSPSVAGQSVALAHYAKRSV